MVSAWAATNRLVLGQVKVNEESNEITAIPELEVIYKEKLKAAKIEARSFYSDKVVASCNAL